MSRSLIPRSGCHQANAPSSAGWSSIQRLFCTRWGMTGGGGGGRGMIVVGACSFGHSQESAVWGSGQTQA